MSTMTDQRTALAALLAAVPGAGIVHKAEPYAKTQQAFQAAYQWDDGQGNKQLRGWFIRQPKIVEHSPSVGRVVNVATWQVRGFMALDSTKDSELVFDDLIEAMRQAYRNDETLGGLVQPGPLGQTTGIQKVDSGPVMFAGVLCHSALLQLTTYAYLNPGE